MQGLDFSSLDLRNVNFANANISFTDFTNCDLRNADLSEANAIGTCFNECIITGACVQHWNIDSRTKFDGIRCDFVYINLNPKVRNSKGEFIQSTPINENNKFDRNPPEGMFAANEFSKIYQQVADTIDFIVQNNSEELRALVGAIDIIRVKSGNEEISVQNFEFKGDSIIVKLKAPPELREQVYKEVKNKFKDKLQLLKNDNKLLRNNNKHLKKERDSFKDLARIAAESRVHIEHKTVTDQSIQIHAPVTNAIINSGSNSTFSNHIEQLPDSHNELKVTLLELQKLLAQSNLPPSNKEQAQLVINELAKVSQQPASERKNLSLIYLAFLEKLQKFGELGVRYGKLIAKLVSWF